MLLFLLCLAVTLSVCDITSGTPSNASIFQLDILYPKPNGTYRRTSPFPIIFAMTGLDTVWQDRPGLVWTLTAVPDDQITNGQGAQLSDDVGSWGSENATAWGPSNPYNFSSPTAADIIVVRDSPGPALSNSTRWELQYVFSHVASDNYSCNVEQWQQHPLMVPQLARSPYFSGSIYFMVTDDALPHAFLSSNECGFPLGNIAFVGRQTARDSCPILMNPRPPLEDCRSRLNDSGSSQIQETFSSGINCGRVDESVGTFNSTLCVRSTVRASSGHPRARVSLNMALWVSFSCVLQSSISWLYHQT